MDFCVALQQLRSFAVGFVRAEFALGTLFYPCAKIESDGMQGPVSARVKALSYSEGRVAMDAVCPACLSCPGSGKAE